MKYKKYLQERRCEKLDFSIVPRSLHVYWLCDNVAGKVIRVGITRNPYLIAAKIPDKTHLILFRAESMEEAELLANNMIADIGTTGQRLFNVYTLGQAMYRLRRVSKNFDIEEIIKSYNECVELDHKILSYCGKYWIHKNVIEDHISIVEFLEERKQNERQ